MLKVVLLRRKCVVMNVCRLCGVGSGVTVYPDGPFVHTQRRLHDDLCDACRASLVRHRNGRTGPAHLLPAERLRFSLPPA